MKVTITIQCDNAAFFDDDDNKAAGSEVARILRKIAKDCAGDDEPCAKGIMDINGNRCGSVEIEP